MAGIGNLMSSYANALGSYKSGGNTIGSDKQYGAWYNKLYGANAKKTEKLDASAFDYKAQQEELKKTLANYKENNTKLQALKKDSADFLTKYTDSMTKTGESAKAVQGENLTKLLGDTSEGKISEENMKKTTDAVQAMVDSYNKSLSTLSDNTERGAGVAQQLNRMSQAPMADSTMKMVGVTRGEGGKLTFDKDKFSASLTSAAKADARLGSSDRMNFIKDIVGGSNSIASGIRQDSQAALNKSANTLVSNDIAKMQQQQNPVNMNNIYTRAGAQGMMNMGAVGLLMNMTA